MRAAADEEQITAVLATRVNVQIRRCRPFRGDFQENVYKRKIKTKGERGRRRERRTTMTAMMRSNASRRANGVAAVLTQRRLSWASWSVYHHPRAHRHKAWAASLASPRGVSRAHLRQRRVSHRGRYIWRRDALEPQPLLSRPSIHNSPSRLVIDPRDVSSLCLLDPLEVYTRKLEVPARESKKGKRVSV